MSRFLAGLPNALSGVVWPDFEHNATEALGAMDAAFRLGANVAGRLAFPALLVGALAIDAVQLPVGLARLGMRSLHE
jgi:hypothetical protein